MVITNAFTVDVEDYYHVSAFERYVPRDNWDRYESRVVTNTRRMLGLLDRHNVKATFFILGWVGQHYPQLVREIHQAGHEIASHGYWHRLIYNQTPEEFRDDIRLSRKLLEDIIGERVFIYRAPSFSVTEQSRWAIEILIEEGYSIDSSIFPIYHDRYGIPGAKPFLHQIDTSVGSLWEFPPSIVRLAGQNLPVSGGGYFRLFPLFWTTWCLKYIGRTTGQPFIFYVHPWETDPEQPRLFKNASLKSRFRHYINLRTTLQKLDMLLPNFRFGTVSEVIGNYAAQQGLSDAIPQLAHKKAIS
ncbi:MAG: XrtA system polysaccharide deacetylase [Thermoguttaceae bacterium]|jgi:polysaccharide deacetylase family protein (PEP-CTERM system associated)